MDVARSEDPSEPETNGLSKSAHKSFSVDKPIFDLRITSLYLRPTLIKNEGL